MTLLIAVPAAIVLGLAFGGRRSVGVITALIWYACLAVQTAYLAHPGRSGFFDVPALPAVQGAGFGQYWISQSVIAVVTVAGLLRASRFHDSRASGRSQPPDAISPTAARSSELTPPAR